MWNSLSFYVKKESLTSLPSLVDLLLPKEQQAARNTHYQILNITTCNQLPLLSTSLLFSGEISQERFRYDLDGIAFNCSSTQLIARPERTPEDGIATTIQQQRHHKFDESERAKRGNGGCKCKKTGCLKMYCQCFNSGRLCSQQCGCHHCSNQMDKIQQIQRARREVQSRRNSTFEQLQISSCKACNCRKSQCQKKYCECFNAGLSCNKHCRCEDCLNGIPHTHTNSAEVQEEFDSS